MKRKLCILLMLAALTALCFCAAAFAQCWTANLEAGDCYAIYGYDDVRAFKLEAKSDDLIYDIAFFDTIDDYKMVIPLNNMTKGFEYITVKEYSYFYDGSKTKPGLIMIIRVQSGEAKLILPNIIPTKGVEARRLSNFPIKYTAAAKGSVNPIILKDKSLSCIPLLIGGTSGTHIKRILSASNNDYELYIFSGNKLYVYTYEGGRKTKSEGISYLSAYTQGEDLYLCASIQIAPSTEYSIGDMQVQKGNALFGLIDGTGISYVSTDSVGQTGDAFYAWDSSSSFLSDITDNIRPAADASDINEENSLYFDVFSRFNYGSGSDPGNDDPVYIDDGSMTVVNGSADCENPAPGTVVHITADAPQEGMAFAGWRSDDVVCFADASASSTYFVMPERSVTVTATYAPKRPVLSVVFEPGGGSGEMARADVREGDVYALPRCAFVAPAGRVFKAWSVKTGGADAVIKNPGDTITVTADVTTTALWKNVPVTTPQIVMNALQLDGTLNLRYYVAVPDDFDEEGAAMRFSLSDKAIPFAEAEVVDGYRVFDCPVYAYQMAEEITATLTYRQDGRRKSTSDIYSVKDYLDDLSELELSDRDAAMVRAVRNYGHYIQPHLYRLHGLNYTEMPKADGNLDIEGARVGSAANACDLKSGTYIDGALITDIIYKLNVNSGTDLVFEFKLAEGVSGEVTAKVGGEAGFTAVTPNESGVYRIAKKRIAANNLEVGYPFTVKVDGVDALSTTVSVLNYVSAVLNSTTVEDDKLAFTALYEYWAAANSY